MSHPNLTKRQEAFCVDVAKGSNASEAYRNAYDAGGMKAEAVHVAASRLLKNAKVALRISSLKEPALRNAGLSVERTLTEVRRISNVDPRRFYREDGSQKPPSEWDDDMAAAVSSCEAIPVVLKAATSRAKAVVGYTYKIKFWNKNAGLEQSMKHLGLFEKDNAQSRESLALIVKEAKRVTR